MSELKGLAGGVLVMVGAAGWELLDWAVVYTESLTAVVSVSFSCELSADLGEWIAPVS